MSGSVVLAASAIAFGAGCSADCEGVCGFGGGVQRTRLLALARADAAAPAPATATIAVRYDQARTARIVHPDAGSTVFVEFNFPPQSILHVNGQPVCDTCTVNVSVATTPGVYGFTLSPATMIFNTSSTPTVTFSYGTYGDLSVHDSSTSYPTPQSFDQALAVWGEVLAEWRRGRNSTRPGAGTVVSGIDGPGAYLLAALK